MTASSTWHSWVPEKYLVHSICPIQSSTATSSASVELHVLKFCCVEVPYTTPLPKLRAIPHVSPHACMVCECPIDPPV